VTTKTNITGPDDLIGAVVRAITTGNYLAFDRHPVESEHDAGYLREYFGTDATGKEREMAGEYTTHYEDVRNQLEDGSYAWVVNPKPQTAGDFFVEQITKNAVAPEKTLGLCPCCGHQKKVGVFDYRMAGGYPEYTGAEVGYYLDDEFAPVLAYTQANYPGQDVDTLRSVASRLADLWYAQDQLK
jgi:hypothetical protein